MGTYYDTLFVCLRGWQQGRNFGRCARCFHSRGLSFNWLSRSGCTRISTLQPYGTLTTVCSERVFGWNRKVKEMEPRFRDLKVEVPNVYYGISPCPLRGASQAENNAKSDSWQLQKDRVRGNAYFEPLDLVLRIHGDELAAHIEVSELDGHEERDVSLGVRFHPHLFGTLFEQLLQNCEIGEKRSLDSMRKIGFSMIKAWPKMGYVAFSRFEKGRTIFGASLGTRAEVWQLMSQNVLVIYFMKLYLEIPGRSVCQQRDGCRFDLCSPRSRSRRPFSPGAISRCPRESTCLPDEARCSSPI